MKLAWNLQTTGKNLGIGYKAYNEQPIPYHNSGHQVTNAAILTFGFNLYDKIMLLYSCTYFTNSNVFL
jgi:hypothetical protein